MSSVDAPDVLPKAATAAAAADSAKAADAIPKRLSLTGRIGLLAYVLAFALVCVLPLTGLALGFKNTNLEKRALSPLPEPLVDGRPNLDAMRAFDDFFADHFAFRTRLVTGWHQLNQMLLRQSGSAKVIAGRSGWLFYADTLADYLATPRLSDAELRRLATTLSLQHEYLAAMGIEFHFTVAPNKNSIYGQYMPSRYKPVYRENNLARWLGGPYVRAVPTIDLLTPLRQAAAASETPVYHRTDSHWNNLGALVGYETLMAAATGQAPRPVMVGARAPGFTTRTDWEGDLAVMLSPSGVALDQQQYFDIPMRYRAQRPIRSFEDMLIQTTLPAAAGPASTVSGAAGAANGTPGDGILLDAGGRKLWMFRDSFANALVPMLANSFAAATFTREVPYNYTGIDKSKADVVILEIVERNMPQMLLRAPIVPAPDRAAPSSGSTSSATTAGSDRDGAAPVMVSRLLAEPAGRMLKIAGRLSGDAAALDAVDRIFVGLKDANGAMRYLEATPIDETAQMSAAAAEAALTARQSGDATLGLTAFIAAGRWQSGQQSIEVWRHQAGRWVQDNVTITLP